MSAPGIGTAALGAVSIGAATAGEAEQLLKLEYLAYQLEAALYDDWSIPPLQETLSELLRAYDRATILSARLGREVVGSVRGQLMDATCHIGRLVVHPRLQRRGIGRRLMGHIESSFPEAAKFALFTGSRSLANLRLYESLGYKRVRDEPINELLTLAHLEKMRGNRQPRRS